MVFSSFFFIFSFLPCVIILYFLLDKRWKNLLLVIASFFFYAWGEPRYLLLLIALITLNYFLAFPLSRQNGNRRKLILAAVVTLDLACLGYFKYYNFFLSSLNTLSGNQLVTLREITLPLGISFFTFRLISYLVDLYREKTVLQPSWVDLSLYVASFPQLTSGPIDHYHDLEPQLATRNISLDDVAYGFERFCFGLAKKVLIANQLAAAVDGIYSKPVAELSSSLAWAAALGYTMQIYFDFSGYSDMAIGLARIFGFHLKENFNYPYLSASITEFWRRWHISLSSWFREYLYIPLGGNRKGSVRTIINLAVVFFLTGLWHGAAWNFIVWGLLHGTFIILERMLLKKKAPTSSLFRIIGIFYTFFVVNLAWVFFRAQDLDQAFGMVRLMFSPQPSAYWNFIELVSPRNIIVFCLSVVLSGLLQNSLLPRLTRLQKPQLSQLREIAAFISAIGLFLLSLVLLANSSFSPFIYFRF